MIVVIVADEDHIDRRQRLGRKRRPTYAPRSYPAERTRMRREDRIGQDHRRGGPNQERRVTDEGNRDAACIHARWRRIVRDHGGVRRPGRALPRAHPSNDFGQRTIRPLVRIEESLAVAVIRHVIDGRGRLGIEDSGSGIED